MSESHRHATGIMDGDMWGLHLPWIGAKLHWQQEPCPSAKPAQPKTTTHIYVCSVVTTDYAYKMYIAKVCAYAVMYNICM